MNTIDHAIVAPATPPGVSALAIVRLSGKNSIEVVQKVFVGKNLLEQDSHSLHLGLLKDGEELIGVISARKADKKDRKRHEQNR